jgi:Domain of unknown function (DUF4440)
MQDCITLEGQGWRALSTGGETAQAFYDSWLADDAVMVFPGGMLIEGKAHILGAIDSQPWTSFRLDRPRVIWRSDTAAVVVYGVTAQHEGAAPSVALISSSSSLCKGQWKPVLHQQTPV